MDYRQFLEESLAQASEIALSYFGNVSPTTKPEDNNQVLTEADIKIGEFLVGEVQRVFADHNIIDEEAGAVDKKSNFTWVIDPIEATSNFASGSTAYAIMMGLLDGDEPIAGGVILPALGVYYSAEKDSGARKNGRNISVSTESELRKMLFSFGIDSQVNAPDRTINECRVLADLVLAARNMRNSGCEGLDPMYVAEGIYGARINTSSKIWDNVGPQIIAEEAGAIWTDTNGEKLDYSEPLKKLDTNFSFCVAPPKLHNQIIDVIGGRL